MLDRAGFESVPFRRVDLGGLDRRRDRRSFRRSPRSDRPRGPDTSATSSSHVASLQHMCRNFFGGFPLASVVTRVAANPCARCSPQRAQC